MGVPKTRNFENYTNQLFVLDGSLSFEAVRVTGRCFGVHFRGETLHSEQALPVNPKSLMFYGFCPRVITYYFVGSDAIRAMLNPVSMGLGI